MVFVFLVVAVFLAGASDDGGAEALGEAAGAGEAAGSGAGEAAGAGAGAGDAAGAGADAAGAAGAGASLPGVGVWASAKLAGTESKRAVAKAAGESFVISKLRA